MCIPIKLQQNIISFTKDGEHIARFLTETMRGKTPGVKVNHRMEAAKHVKGGAMKDHRGGDKLYHLAHC